MEKYDPNNPKHVKEARATSKLNEVNEVEDLRKILSQPEGRRLIWKYLSWCGIYQAGFVQNGSLTYFNEGQRNIGMKMQAEIITTFPAAFIQMMAEHNQEQK